MGWMQNDNQKPQPKTHMTKADTGQPRNPRLIRNEMDDAKCPPAPLRGFARVCACAFAGVRVTDTSPGPLDLFLLTVFLLLEGADPGESTRSKVCVCVCVDENAG